MNGDRPIGESNRQYTLGFVMTLVGAALHGFVNAGVEYSHVKAVVVVTFDLVMQMQFLISMFSALFCIVAMIINKDLQVTVSVKSLKWLERTYFFYYLVVFLSQLGMYVRYPFYFSILLKQTKLKLYNTIFISFKCKLFALFLRQLDGYAYYGLLCVVII